ncbi:hypothetical protein [Candidatus Magnetaquiglobus chichijimensis]
MKISPLIVALSVFFVPDVSWSTPQYPESAASYTTLDREVGCKSQYSSDKKDNIFKSQYYNHWMTWTGTVELSSANSASLNIDRMGTADLRVEFADDRAGYDLLKGSIITVRFLMKSEGGCFLPFSGTNAVIVTPQRSTSGYGQSAPAAMGYSQPAYTPPTPTYTFKCRTADGKDCSRPQ